MRAFILGIISLLALSSCSRAEGEAYSKGIDAYGRGQYAEAEPFIRQAAKRGHVDGMSILGAMYLFGRSVPANGKQAEYWLLKAAASTRNRSLGSCMRQARRGAKSS